MIDPKEHPLQFFLSLAAVGAVFAIGKMLNSTEKLTARIVVGRAVVNACLAASAGAASVFFPDASPLVMYGLAAALSSLGTSALEQLIRSKTGAAE